MIMLGSTGISLASAQQAVNGLYQQYYNRLPTQAEAADWEGVLINGSQSVAQVSQQFAAGGLQYTRFTSTTFYNYICSSSTTT